MCFLSKNDAREYINGDIKTPGNREDAASVQALKKWMKADSKAQSVVLSINTSEIRPIEGCQTE